MINIGLIPFVIILQIFIFLLISLVILWFLLRAKNKQLNAIKAGKNSNDDVSSVASIEHYLTAEIKLTQGRFDLFYKDDDIKSENFVEPDWLMLRKNFLEIEKVLIAFSEREDVFWLEAGKKLKLLLNNSYLVKRIMKEVEEDDEDETVEMKNLLKSQQEKFDEVSLMMEGSKTEAEMLELKEKIMTIVRSHKELSHCMIMLEEENHFMRDQIAALLK